MGGLAGLVCGALVAAAPAGEARADAPTDFLGAREIAMGDSQRADARGALATTLNPAGLALSRELVFEGVFSLQPKTNQRLGSIAACDSTVALPGCYYFRYLAGTAGGDEDSRRRAIEGGAAFARAFGPRVIAGFTVKYFDYEADLPAPGGDEPEDVRGFGFDLGAIVRLSEQISVAVVGHDLATADATQYPRSVAAGAVVRPGGAFSLALDGLWNLETAAGESTGRYGGGAQFFFRSGDMQTGYPIRLGGVYDARSSASFVTGGIGMVSARYGIDLGGRFQVGGEGDELTVVASLRFFGPRDVVGGL